MPVREATPADVPLVRGLQSLLPHPVADLFEDGLPPGVTLVAVPDGARVAPDAVGDATPVGYLHAYTTGYVAEIAVAPAHRGRGHGRALLSTCLAELRARGVERAELEVAADNDRARSLYETLGFEVVARREGRYESGDGLRMVVEFVDE
jgi:ribosomal-protein-alanine N-acetyltransferase